VWEHFRACTGDPFGVVPKVPYRRHWCSCRVPCQQPLVFIYHVRGYPERFPLGADLRSPPWRPDLQHLMWRFVLRLRPWRSASRKWKCHPQRMMQCRLRRAGAIRWTRLKHLVSWWPTLHLHLTGLNLPCCSAMSLYYGFLHGCYPIYPVSDRSIRLDPIRLDAVT